MQLAGVLMCSPCAADELASLVEGKYRHKYDLAIARRGFAGKDFVSLNVMWVHLGQRSFPMSEEQYFDKLGGTQACLKYDGGHFDSLTLSCNENIARRLLHGSFAWSPDAYVWVMWGSQKPALAFDRRDWFVLRYTPANSLCVPCRYLHDAECLEQAITSACVPER
jgi:Domain of unknown function (DUF3067)